MTFSSIRLARVSYVSLSRCRLQPSCLSQPGSPSADSLWGSILICVEGDILGGLPSKHALYVSWKSRPRSSKWGNIQEWWTAYVKVTLSPLTDKPKLWFLLQESMQFCLFHISNPSNVNLNRVNRFCTGPLLTTSPHAVGMAMHPTCDIVRYLDKLGFARAGRKKGERSEVCTKTLLSWGQK